MKKILIAFIGMMLLPAIVRSAPFAQSVLDISLNSPSFPAYLPAPGQFLMNPNFNNPVYAVGAPDSHTSVSAMVSLGGFGGQIVLAFDHDVQDNPANPYGVDAIVFSNAIYRNSPQNHWAEFATIEIMPELNGNNIPGDAEGENWYLIAGSHLTSSESFMTATWNKAEFQLPDMPLMIYPPFANWPTTYNTQGFELTPDYAGLDGSEIMLINPNFTDTDPNNDSNEAYWGYAEYTPTLMPGDRDGDNSNTGYGDDINIPAELFYTTPDNPFKVGITPGSGGGDGFDIAWAVDRQTFELANLASFRYIRLTTAVDAYLNNGYDDLGEVSAEIDAVADARPFADLNGDDIVNFFDYAVFAGSFKGDWPDEEFESAADIKADNTIDVNDLEMFTDNWELYFSG